MQINKTLSPEMASKLISNSSIFVHASYGYVCIRKVLKNNRILIECENKYNVYHYHKPYEFEFEYLSNHHP